MNKRMVVISNIVLILTSFGIVTASFSGEMANPVLAEEAIETQSSEQALVVLKDTVLEKLHALAGGTGADQVFFERVSLTKEGQIQVYADVDTVIQNIQRESFRMDLIEEIRTQANRLYKENGLHREDSFVALYSHQRPESNLPSAIRYGFEEVKLTFSDIYSYQIEYLLNQYIKDENELVRNKQFILQHLQNYIPKIKDVLEVQGEYNRVLRLFNAQDEGERKTEFEAFADEMVRDISTSLQQIIWSDKESILAKIQKFESRILGTQLERSELEKAKQELEELSQQYTTKIQALPHIDSTADWNYLTVSQSDLENAKTVEEIKSIIENNQLNWQFFYKKLQEISKALIKINELEKSLGGDGTTTFRIPGQTAEAIVVPPSSPKSSTTVSTSEDFVATKETVQKRNIDVMTQVWNIYYSATEEEFLKNQVILDQALHLEEKSIQVEHELVEEYNSRIDKINELSSSIRHETWIKFIYPKDFYLIEALHLTGNKWSNLDEIENHKQKVLAWMREFDVTFLTENNTPEPKTDSNHSTDLKNTGSQSEVPSNTTTPQSSSGSTSAISTENNKNQTTNSSTQVGSNKNANEQGQQQTSQVTTSANANSQATNSSTNKSTKGISQANKAKVTSKVLPKTGLESNNLNLLGILIIATAIQIVTLAKRRNDTM
ncbi:TPA: hypothetical protein ACGO7H_002031 [Streptococcus suis]